MVAVFVLQTVLHPRMSYQVAATPEQIHTTPIGLYILLINMEMAGIVQLQKTGAPRYITNMFMVRHIACN